MILGYYLGLLGFICTLLAVIKKNIYINAMPILDEKSNNVVPDSNRMNGIESSEV